MAFLRARAFGKTNTYISLLNGFERRTFSFRIPLYWHCQTISCLSSEYRDFCGKKTWKWPSNDMVNVFIYSSISRVDRVKYHLIGRERWLKRRRNQWRKSVVMTIQLSFDMSAVEVSQLKVLDSRPSLRFLFFYSLPFYCGQATGRAWHLIKSMKRRNFQDLTTKPQSKRFSGNRMKCLTHLNLQAVPQQKALINKSRIHEIFDCYISRQRDS